MSKSFLAHFAFVYKELVHSLFEHLITLVNKLNNIDF